jgi:hypothetical protein
MTIKYEDIHDFQSKNYVHYVHVYTLASIVHFHGKYVCHEALNVFFNCKAHSFTFDHGYSGSTTVVNRRSPLPFLALI